MEGKLVGLSEGAGVMPGVTVAGLLCLVTWKY